jgi:hypothetical protein
MSGMYELAARINESGACVVCHSTDDVIICTLATIDGYVPESIDCFPVCKTHLPMVKPHPALPHVSFDIFKPKEADAA